MNYKEMLDKFDYLEGKLNFLELENRHLKQRVAKLEGDSWFNKPIGPTFTPGTLPQSPWPNPNQIWCSDNTNPQDGFK